MFSISKKMNFKTEIGLDYNIRNVIISERVPNYEQCLSVYSGFSYYDYSVFLSELVLVLTMLKSNAYLRKH
jgi:hypothetical protein